MLWDLPTLRFGKSQSAALSLYRLRARERRLRASATDRNGSKVWVALFNKRSPSVAGPDCFREPGRTAETRRTANAQGTFAQGPQRPRRPDRRRV